MGETLIRHLDKGTCSICEVPKIKQVLQGARTMSSADQTESNNAAVSSPTERRHHLRFPFSATVEAVEIKSGTKITGRTSDLGLGGCYVDTLSPFPVGTEAKMRIIRETETFEAQVRVVYSLIGMGMGLAF